MSAEQQKSNATPKPTGKKSAGPKLTRRQRWDKYSRLRVINARKSLRRVRQLTNAASYDYSPEEWHPILAALQADIDGIKASVKGPPKEKGLYDL